jgi:hypothetical protein
MRSYLIKRLGLLFLVACVSSPLTSTAQSPDRPVILSPAAEQDLTRVQVERIRSLRREAGQLYKNGAYDVAAQRLQQLFEMTDDPTYLFELAITYQQLYDWEKCVGYMGRYLETAPEGPKKDRARNIQQSCKVRQQGSQTLIIETEPRGANVYLGNRKTVIQGQTPFQAQRPTGVERVWLELEGYEPEIKDIQIRKDEPMRLRVILRKRVDLGWLFVDSTVVDAQVYLDGKALQLTPFDAPISVRAGWHQVKVQREGFTPLTERIKIDPFLLSRVDAQLARSSQVKTWRSNAGMLSVIFGVLGVIGGGTAMYLANDEYNDTAKFDELVGYQDLGYGVGGALIGVGTSLLLWDSLRDSVLDSDKNPDYGREVETPDPIHTPVLGVFP